MATAESGRPKGTRALALIILLATLVHFHLYRKKALKTTH